MTTSRDADGGPGGQGHISIGVMTGGAVAAGAGAHAIDAAVRTAAGRPGEVVDAPPELLGAIRTLREHLRMMTPTDETAQVDEALATLEEDLSSTGRTERGQLALLASRLNVGATALAGLASAVAVAQTISTLLG
ncbi:hypothetical protein [Streptomyces spectabilis]|uniref:Uncharacterized protein n=1 Tax=Streptomyces spectabilis TaxID=68270 RepID=A0A5P2XI34_STRST|nr:hypothetical protein [Streptomyces spectabilis]MBB5102408.1 hypothetical protein [Streptomyces spectabilis]MCI3907450.1 hypothetical protein [Streptomyces spectabilis]QEV64158.1 hypothetical protein CP982_40250 [Streptomyces spectabilis]GGV32015.1 hypothetical protein GCM10010245_51980 [Streptomyces spectabilis]